MKIHLADWHRPKWCNSGHIHCRGHLIDKEGWLYEGFELCLYMQKVKTLAELKDILCDSNGHFAVIIELEHKILAAVDHAATIPLYYADLIIGDDALSIPSAKVISEAAKSEYLLSGYMMGNQTLFSDIFIIPAGNILSMSKNQAQTALHPYYSYTHLESSWQGETAMFDLLDHAHLKAIQRLIERAAGSQIALPLSGGYDSRLIAILLKKLGYDNILAFSYGSPHSRESHISKVVAAYLDIPHHFIQHKAKNWFDAYQSEERKEYYRKCGLIGSRPYMQDWLAIKELKERGLLQNDAIITPGHSGDFLEGTSIPALFMTNEKLEQERVVNQIYKQLYNLWPHSLEVSAPIKEQISSYLQLPKLMSNEEAASFLEQFIWQHHQAKYYLNGNLAYEFFGFAWALPWWDKELMHFWRKVPLKLRYKRRFYISYVKQRQNLDIPIFYKQYLPIRAYQWLARKHKGRGYDARWHRFADLHKNKDARVESLIHPQMELPSFIQPQSRIADCDINGLQALVALSQLGVMR